MNIAVYASTDSRTRYIYEELVRRGHVVRLWEEGDAPRAGEALILPIPSTRDGVHINAPSGDPLTKVVTQFACVLGAGLPPSLLTHLRERGVTAWDLLQYEPFVLENARLTAEGAVALGLQATQTSFLGEKVAILGYGRIGSYLARYLLALGAEVRVFARREIAREAALHEGALAFDTLSFAPLADCALLYNTVPEKLLSVSDIVPTRLTHLIELASGRGNLPTTDRPVIDGQGLPGKLLPLSAGILVANTFDTLRKEVTI